MVKMGKVCIEFTESEVRAAESRWVNGRMLYRVYYDTEVDLFSERGDLQFRATLNGISKGNATIQFERSYDTMEV